MKSEFLTELQVEEMDAKTWRLLKPLIYHSELLNETITVPSGYVTDFASIPRLPIIYWLFGDTARKPAVIHDFLYQTHGCDNRHEADRVFYEGMGAIEMPKWRRWDMYLGVRLGGLTSWLSGPRRYRKLNDSGLERK